VLLCMLDGSNFFSRVQKSLMSLKYKTGDPADWKKELDAVIAAPDYHKVLLGNDKNSEKRANTT